MCGLSRQSQGTYIAALLSVGALRAKENDWILKKRSKSSPQTSAHQRVHNQKKSTEMGPGGSLGKKPDYYVYYICDLETFFSYFGIRFTDFDYTLIKNGRLFHSVIMSTKCFRVMKHIGYHLIRYSSIY